MGIVEIKRYPPAWCCKNEKNKYLGTINKIFEKYHIF